MALVSEGDRVVTHYFESKEPGYRGWRWAVTVARASRAKNVTLDETVLLPGSDALLAPEWVPWSERLRPGDMGPGDLLPTEAEDPRLEPGWTGEDEPLPNSPVSEVSQELAALADAEDAELTTRPGTSRGSIAAVADELGTRRARVLSRYGLRLAADRWDEEFGAKTPMAQAAPASCVTCAFLVPMAGSLKQAFGVCANEFAPADGRVVSLAYGCGGTPRRRSCRSRRSPRRTRWTRCGWTTTRCVRPTTPARCRAGRTARRTTSATPDAPGRWGVRARGARASQARGPCCGPARCWSWDPLVLKRRTGLILPGAGGFRVAVPSGAHWASGSPEEWSASVSMNATEGADPFGTARLRRGVLDAWGAGPARFREDANAEEDLALGGYRDRLVVELAQNAADAAARAGVPGRLRLTLHEADGNSPAVLAAANNGAPLDATGVESLSTLRASAKREGHETSVGRFGVGFAAVLAVSDEPAVIGRHGGVRWSLAEARDLARQAAVGSPGLGDELRRRDGHVPLLRLPLPAEGTAPDGYDTVVVLPLRDGVAEDLVGRLLGGVDDALLLTLPGLDEVVIETPDGVRTLRRSQHGPYTHVDDSAHGLHRWRTIAAHGPVEPALLADRPVEERLRPHWSVTWAVPVGEDGAPQHPRTAPVVHAPTPTDEPLGVPALLIASLPLDTTRRHPAPGPLTDFLVQRAADAYAELLAGWEPVSVATIALVPAVLGKGQLDGALRAAILERLPRVAFLEPAAPRDPAEAAAQWDDWDGAGAPSPGTTALRPVEAEVVEGVGDRTVRVLAEVLPCLLPAGLERRVELRTLGVARVPLTEAIDRLAGLERDPDWWRRLYDSLAGVDPDRLSGLPVPLAGPADAPPRTTIGPRQVLLPLPDALTSPVLDRLARLGLKVAHPDAAHPCWRSWAPCRPPPCRAADPAGPGRRRGLAGRGRDLGRGRAGRGRARRHRPHARTRRGPRARRRALAGCARPARRGRRARARR